MTAYALAFFAFGLVAHSLLEVVTRGFYVLHDTWTPVKIGIGAMVVNAALGLLLLQPMQQGGLALANTLATTLETLLLLWLIRGRLGGIGGRQLSGTLARSLAATAVMAGALLIFVNLAAGWSGPLTAVAGVLVGAAVYGGMALLLGREEFRRLRQTV